MAFTRPKAAQIDFDVTNISDPLIRLNSTETGSADKDAGIVIERGSDTNVAIIYDESADQFAVINTDEVGTTSGNVTITSYADIKANAFYGDGSNLTGISASGGAFTTESDGASLTSTTSGSSAEPVVTLHRDITGADANYIGQIKFTADNDADQKTVFAKITAKIGDASDGTEDGIIEIAHKKAGSNNISARFTSTDLKLINGTGLEVAGNVGIGSSAPSRKLELNNGGIGTLATFTDGVATNFTFKTDGSSVGTFGTEAGGTQLAFMVANTEAARFDGSRNFLVGKSSSSTTTAGFETQSSGLTAIVRDSNTPLYVGRNSNDGDIVVLRQGSTTIGSIKAGNGDLLIGTGDVNLRFFDTTPAVIPRTAADGTSSAVVDLGNVSNSFKDLYCQRVKGAAGHTGEVHFTGSHDVRFVTNGNERMRIASDGSVGIGTASPDATLKVVSSGANLLVGFNGTQNYFDASENIFRNFAGAERGRFNSAGALLIGKTSDSISNNGISASGSATGGGHLSVTNDGNSCVTLNRKSSDGEIIGFRKDGTTIGSIGSLSDRMYAGSGDVGVFFDSTNNMITPYSIDAGDTTNGVIDLGYSGGRFNKGYFNDSVRTRYFAGVDDSNTFIEMGGSDIMKFVAGGSERGRFDSSGLTVTGVMSGTATQARYADLAEKYVSDKPAMAGTVMVFGGSKEVTISQTAQDRKMAGVVSTDPAYLMNSGLDAENTVAIALQGRVPCKVQGFVRKGDMMVTGSLPGVAQAWREEGDPPYGTVIGKSLEDKDSRGTGVIEVVVGVR